MRAEAEGEVEVASMQVEDEGALIQLEGVELIIMVMVRLRRQ